MVIYVHPIENKVTIVRRDNKVTISHVGVQGERGPELMIQYSRDGVSGWHAVPTVDDNYLRFSSDEGRTWGNAIWFNTIDECHDYMIKSQAWAENPVDTEVENGKYSALHHRVYAEQAENEAKQARDNATASMNAAAAFAGSASQSASNALSSANDAELSKQKAYQWAENPENDEVEPGQYSALHHALQAKKSEITAAEYAIDAAKSAVEAFGAAAPPWDSETVYSYNDVISFDNGHTYRCIGINITGADYAPNINGIDNEEYWTRITVAPNGYFEIDEDGNIMPMISPITSEIFMLDEYGDITYQ